MKRKGFTLTELLITLVILSVLSMVVFPVVTPAMQNNRLSACAERMADELRYVRSLSMTNPDGDDSVYSMRFLVTSNYYDAQRYDGSNLLPVEDPLQPGETLSVDLDTDTEFQGITIQNNRYVSFDSKGRPYGNSWGSGSPISTILSVTLQNSAGNERTVSVYPKTGTVTVQ